MKIDIEALYRKYGPMVLRRCRYLMRDEELAEDMMQEVFTNLVRNSEALTDQAPSSLLYTMATNTCLNAIKARQTRAKYSSSVDTSEVELTSHDREQERIDTKDLLDAIFAQDDEKTRTIAWMHYVDLHTLEETAQQHGMSVSGVRKRLRKLQTMGAEFREEAV